MQAWAEPRQTPIARRSLNYCFARTTTACFHHFLTFRNGTDGTTYLTLWEKAGLLCTAIVYEFVEANAG